MFIYKFYWESELALEAILQNNTQVLKNKLLLWTYGDDNIILFWLTVKGQVFAQYGH